MPKTTKTAPAAKPPTKTPPAAKKPACGPLAVAPGRALSTAVNPEEDAGKGGETMTAKDMAIPQLIILQSGSPQVKKSDGAHIKGAEEGMICDPVNEKIWDGEEGLYVIPVAYRRSHIEWKDRDSGGGFVKDHGTDGSIMDQLRENKKGKLALPNGNTVGVVAEYFVFLVEPETGEYTPYVLRMASTQLKKSRRWNTMINQLRVPRASGEGTYNPAMFYRVYHFSTIPESNDKGSWFGWKIVGDADTLSLPEGEAIYQAARDFHGQVASGAVKTHAPVHEGGEHSGGAESPDSPL